MDSAGQKAASPEGDAGCVPNLRVQELETKLLEEGSMGDYMEQYYRDTRSLDCSLLYGCK